MYHLQQTRCKRYSLGSRLHDFLNYRLPTMVSQLLATILYSRLIRCLITLLVLAIVLFIPVMIVLCFRFYVPQPSLLDQLLHHITPAQERFNSLLTATIMGSVVWMFALIVIIANWTHLFHYIFLSDGNGKSQVSIDDAGDPCKYDIDW